MDKSNCNGLDTHSNIQIGLSEHTDKSWLETLFDWGFKRSNKFVEIQT